MTQENKQLLLTDLCARLPYGVKFNYGGYDGCCFKVEIITSTFINALFPIEKCRLYLRPMSSMTDEEEKEYHGSCDGYLDICFDSIDSIDWLNEHHFDFRNLIERGLAIDCTNLNIY